MSRPRRRHPPPEPGGAAFQSVLTDAISKVRELSAITQTPASTVFFQAKARNCIRWRIKTQQADVSFDLFMQVRNKIVAAYHQ